MSFPLKRYNSNSIYILNNGYFLDPKPVPGSDNRIFFQVKSPEGAILEGNFPIFPEGNSSLIKSGIEAVIGALSVQLNFDGLSLQDIIQKTEIPPIPKNHLFKIIGKVVDKDNTPLQNVKVEPLLLTPPPTPPNAGSGDLEEYSDLDNTIITLGAAIILNPDEIPFTDENGSFEYVYESGEEIDFEKSYLTCTKDTYFPKQVGPKLLKSGEVIVKEDNNPQNNEVPSFILNNGYEIKFEELGPKITAVVFENGSEIGRGDPSFSSGYDILAQEQAINYNTSIKQRLPAEEEGTSLETTLTYDIYDLGKIILESTELNLEKEEAEVRTQIQEVENIEIEIAGKSNLPFEVRLTNIFNKQKENLKRTLFAAIIVLLAKFGPNIVHSIFSGIKNPLADKICPTPEEIREIIRKRNQLVKQLNNIYKKVRTITNILKITGALIIGLKITLRAAQIASAVPPGKFAWNGVLEGAFKGIDKRLEIAGISVTILTIIAAVIGTTLSIIIELLRNLDFLIQDCSEEINPETGEPNISFVEINDEINNFIDSTTGEEDDLIDPLTGNPLPYKGFTFEIKDDTSQNFKYPKRFAIARNIQGVQLLRSESSFASSPQILIEELKFQIDKNNLRAD